MEMMNVDSVYEALCSLKEEDCKAIMYKLVYKFRDNTNNSQKSFDYYHKNKEAILRKIKEKKKSEEEKLRIKQVRLEWYEKNKEKIREKNKNYYHQKKMEKMAEKANIAVEV